MKIYLGYAAGVGKTYQMLLEARRLLEDGIDVAVGLVETHGRAETQELVEGLEIIPRHITSYRGIEIGEMDLDAVLSRRPAVVLVDELAHTNVPGSKNVKRYQDVEEILSAGIHVISTLNIQHLESLYETVERATGVKVRERIPDRIVLEADQVVNVDITTEDLRQRLQEGKVYTTERIDIALDHFFRQTNLEQLRELTLRELAAQIDSRSRGPLAEEIPSSPDQVMVALSSRGPNSQALLRYASRLAGRLNRNWYAVYVQTPQENPTMIDAQTQRRLSNTLTLAQQLGATVFTYKGEDIVKTLLQFAREYRVGHLVIGTPGRKLSFWQRLRGQVSLGERLLTEAQGLTIVVLDTNAIKDEVRLRPSPPPASGTASTKELTSQAENALSDTRTILWSHSVEKEWAMKQLFDVCCCESVALQESAWKSVLQREQQGGTFVGEDVAIPHARVTGLPRPHVALGIAPEGILDPVTERSVRFMFLLLSPAEPSEIHLSLLAMISRMARDDQWRRESLAVQKPAEIIRIIRNWKRRVTAAK